MTRLWVPRIRRAALAAPSLSPQPTRESAVDGLDVRLTAARLVAEHWRDEAMKDPQAPVFWGAVAHACAMVLAALDGETDPRQLGITEAKHAAFRAALREPSREPGEELRREIVADTEATEREPEQW